MHRARRFFALHTRSRAGRSLSPTREKITPRQTSTPWELIGSASLSVSQERKKVGDRNNVCWGFYRYFLRGRDITYYNFIFLGKCVYAYARASSRAGNCRYFNDVEKRGEVYTRNYWKSKRGNLYLGIFLRQCVPLDSPTVIYITRLNFLQVYFLFACGEVYFCRRERGIWFHFPLRRYS